MMDVDFVGTVTLDPVCEIREGEIRLWLVLSGFLSCVSPAVKDRPADTLGEISDGVALDLGLPTVCSADSLGDRVSRRSNRPIVFSSPEVRTGVFFAEPRSLTRSRYTSSPPERGGSARL